MNAFEGRIFRYGLLLCILFRVIRSINEYSLGAPMDYQIVGFLNLVVFVALFFIAPRYRVASFVVLHSVIISTMYYIWEPSGGFNGFAPYVVVVLLAYVVFSADGILLGVTIAAYSVSILFLMYSDIDPNRIAIKDENQLLIQFNFLLCTFLLIRVAAFGKNRFLKYQEYIKSVNRKLANSSSVLKTQAAQIQLQRNQLDTLRENLEAQIAAKNLERATKEEVLANYAFVNAHHVRGPLARILGLINLLEREPMSAESAMSLQSIKAHANEIDGIVRKINDVLND